MRTPFSTRRPPIVCVALVVCVLALLPTVVVRNIESIRAKRLLLGAGRFPATSGASLTDHQRATLWSGLLALNRGDTAAAIKLLEEAGGTLPSAGMARIPLGDAYLRAGQDERAVATWQTAGAASRLLVLGRNAARARQWSTAIPALQAAWQLTPSDPDTALELARALGQGRQDPAAAERVLRRALAERPAGQASVDLELALAQLEASQGRWEEALTGYRAAAGANPGNAQAHIGLAHALYYGFGRLVEAAAELDLAARLAPHSAAPAMEMAAIYRAEQRYDLATEWYRRAAEAQPNSPWPWTGQAELAFASGNLSNAVSILENASTRFTSEPHIRYLLARAYRQSGQAQSAVNAAEDCVALDGRKSADYLLELGAVYELAGRTLEGSAVYREVLGLDPANRAALARLAALGQQP